MIIRNSVFRQPVSRATLGFGELNTLTDGSQDDIPYQPFDRICFENRGKLIF